MVTFHARSQVKIEFLKTEIPDLLGSFRNFNTSGKYYFFNETECINSGHNTLTAEEISKHIPLQIKVSVDDGEVYFGVLRELDALVTLRFLII